MDPDNTATKRLPPLPLTPPPSVPEPELSYRFGDPNGLHHQSTPRYKYQVMEKYQNQLSEANLFPNYQIGAHFEFRPLCVFGGHSPHLLGREMTCRCENFDEFCHKLENYILDILRIGNVGCTYIDVNRYSCASYKMDSDTNGNHFTTFKIIGSNPQFCQLTSDPFYDFLMSKMRRIKQYLEYVLELKEMSYSDLKREYQLSLGKKPKFIFDKKTKMLNKLLSGSKDELLRL